MRGGGGGDGPLLYVHGGFLLRPKTFIRHMTFIPTHDENTLFTLLCTCAHRIKSTNRLFVFFFFARRSRHHRSYTRNALLHITHAHGSSRSRRVYYAFFMYINYLHDTRHDIIIIITSIIIVVVTVVITSFCVYVLRS